MTPIQFQMALIDGLPKLSLQEEQSGKRGETFLLLKVRLNDSISMSRLETIIVWKYNFLEILGSNFFMTADIRMRASRIIERDKTNFLCP